ncbi:MULTISPECIES: hypothetical protein [Pseudomonas]|uniref:hypothetical protein n=1 Tax=Pseudomonas TaxID=286 RepID=UPI0025959ACD|nr:MULTISPECIES: hypothetical protein [Pseudomonas]
MGLVEPTSGVDSLHMWALADFFDALNGGITPAEIRTVNGSARTGSVLLARGWIDTLVEEAEERAAAAAGYSTMTGAPPEHLYGNTAPAKIEPEQRSGSDPKLLAVRQEHLRQQGQYDLAEQFEAERAARLRAELEAAELRANLITSISHVEQTQEENGQLRRELNEERRARLEAEEVIEEERSARLIAEEKLIEAEAALATLPQEIKHNFNNLADLVLRVSKLLNKDQGAKEKIPTSHLLVIAGLLELVTAKQKARLNQGGAAIAIAAKGWYGAGERQVNNLFAVAKKAAKTASLEAIAKAQEIQDSNKPMPD